MTSRPRGYYAWKKRPLCARKRGDGELTQQIAHLFVVHRGVYGSPRILAPLRAQETMCGRRRVMRLMGEAQLSARSRSQRRRTTHADPTAGGRIAPNVLGRDFSAQAPNRKWLADITAIPAQEVWRYLAVVLDVFSRLIVGWAMDAVQDEQRARTSVAHGTGTARTPSRIAASLRSGIAIHQRWLR